ncbi:hypothetical protein O9993_15735 [Vibrio lentus]|nr:hypothetical protein [Vibrio lentus]
MVAIYFCIGGDVLIYYFVTTAHYGGVILFAIMASLMALVVHRQKPMFPVWIDWRTWMTGVVVNNSLVLIRIESTN